MYPLNITDIYEFLGNSTDKENEGFKIIIRYLLFSKPSSIV